MGKWWMIFFASSKRWAARGPASSGKATVWLSLVLSGLLVVGSSGVGVGQTWPQWADEAFGRRPYEAPRDRYQGRLEERQELKRQHVRDGGPRSIIQAVAPPIVSFPHGIKADSIVIDVGERKLYYVLTGGRAYSYPIGVGRDGFGWTGTEAISRKQEWPDWYPPAEMRVRDPTLPEKMTGGLRNPLGAMALYLGTTLYRIHGTNDASSIGRAESSGCFRMLNSAVLHLASITEIGTPVSVISALPDQQLSQAMPPETARSAGPSQRSSAARASHTQDYRTLRDLTLKKR
jgi:lipoprotein-anchoring transpeptidase ErfK/SrfK